MTAATLSEPIQLGAPSASRAKSETILQMIAAIASA